MHFYWVYNTPVTRMLDLVIQVMLKAVGINIVEDIWVIFTSIPQPIQSHNSINNNGFNGVIENI